MGIPMGLQYSITAIGTVILQYFVNGLGSDAVASIAAAMKINMFFSCPFDALGSTMATYGGQNVGALKFDRLAKGMKSAIILAAVYSVAALALMIFFGGGLASLFLDADQAVLRGQVRTFLIINTAFFIPLSIVNIVRFLIQGMGFSSFAVIAGICEMAARSAVGMFLVPAVGYVGACFASPIAWVSANVFLIPAFFYCRKKLRIKYGTMVPKE